MRLHEILERYKEQSVIVYCNSRKAVDALTEQLNREGWRAAGYHAGMNEIERKQAQDDFSENRIRIMVATCAFGMGIDKPDVRCVVHYSMPRSIEAYYQ